MASVPDTLVSALAGRYRLERELGAGGMATVYLAHDARHERRVALKVLKPELAAVIGAERFLAEIKTTANLQHPHILALFDSGEVQGTVFYVMPYVEGESLRDRLTRETQLPVDEAVRIAREVADALDYAHRHGVVHRDIKPENILLHDGRALVADFGIALAVSRSDGGTRMTETGMSLGTPHYMSPEQAMGEREITPRSDVYALGCVLYEMLAGEPPFTGPTPQAIVARVLTEAPRSLSAQRRTIPPHVEATVRRALEKLPADRFQSASKFAEALAAPAVTGEAGGAGAPVTAPSHPLLSSRLRGAATWLRHPALPWSLVAALFVTLIGLVLLGPDRGTALPRLRFTVDMDQAQSFPGTNAVLVTTDGKAVLSGGIVDQRTVILSRRLDEMTSRVIPGSEGALRPALSPDGRFVLFAARGKLMKLPIEGGTAVPLADARWGGAAWGADGRIVFTESYQGGLRLVSETGGEVRALTEPDSTTNELGHWWPQWLPDGKTILFTAYRSPIAKATIEAYDVERGTRKVLVEGGVMPRYVGSGHLLYARDETVIAVPFDADRLEVRGAAAVVLEGVHMNFVDGFASWDVSPSGTLAFMSRETAGSRASIVEVDRRGIERPIIATPDRYGNPRWSPDGGRISFDQTPLRNASDVWVYDLVRASRFRVTSEEGADFGATWTPDGRDLIYMSERPFFDLYRRAADASRPAAVVLRGGNDRITGDVSPASNRLAFTLSRSSASDIWTVPLDDPARAQEYLATGFQLGHPALSPDGRWMAYDSDESGRLEVYVQSFPDAKESRTQVSADGGGEPAWTRGGRELVFRKSDSVMVVSIDPATGKPGKASTLFVGSYGGAADWSVPRSYDVSADGERFLLLKLPPGDARRRVNVVTDWLTELRERVPR